MHTMTFTFHDMATAVKTNDLMSFRSGLEQGFPVHEERERLLRYVSCYDRFDMIRILVEEYNADFTMGACSPFRTACMRDKSLNTIKYFIGKGVDVHSIENNLPLVCAAMRGNLPAVEFLIEEMGMDQSKYNYLALRYAINYKQHKVVDYLQRLRETNEMIQRKKQWLQVIEEELIQKAWHPRRLLWCLDSQEAAEVGLTEILC